MNNKTLLTLIALLTSLGLIAASCLPKSQEEIDKANATAIAAWQMTNPPPTGDVPTAEPPPTWMTFEGRAEIGEDRVRQVIEGAKLWVSTYGACPQNIVVSPMDAQVTPLPGGMTSTSVENAWPGHIKISQEDNALYITLHAMTHACAGPKINIDPPLEIEDGKIIAVEGLTLIVKLNSGKISMFTKIEEAIAERNAAYAKIGYTISDYRYHNLGVLGQTLFPKDNTSVIQYLKTSDIYGFVGEVLKKRKEIVTTEDIVKVIQMFDDEWKKPQN